VWLRRLIPALEHIAKLALDSRPRGWMQVVWFDSALLHDVRQFVRHQAAVAG
jgi:hypothetical protein